MKTTIETLCAFIAALVVGVAWGQTTVNQGAPGTQGPWKVTSTGTTVISLDGGVVFVQARQCAGTSADGGSIHSNTSAGVASLPIPATARAGRIYETICNSTQNAGSSIVKCRGDGVAPVFAAGNAGDVLNSGDCFTYPQPASLPVQCIASGAAINVLSYECVPL